MACLDMNGNPFPGGDKAHLGHEEVVLRLQLLQAPVGVAKLCICLWVAPRGGLGGQRRLRHRLVAQAGVLVPQLQTRRKGSGLGSGSG